jgi:hypothetical protein
MAVHDAPPLQRFARRPGLGIEVVKVEDKGWDGRVRQALDGAVLAVMDVTEVNDNLRAELAMAFGTLGAGRVILRCRKVRRWTSSASGARPWPRFGMRARLRSRRSGWLRRCSPTRRAGRMPSPPASAAPASGCERLLDRVASTSYSRARPQ